METFDEILNDAKHRICCRPRGICRISWGRRIITWISRDGERLLCRCMSLEIALCGCGWRHRYLNDWRCNVDPSA